MSAVKKVYLVSVEEYLEGELTSPVKHEYLGGMVYAMAGAINRHNRIASNILGAFHGLLRNKRCQPFNSDTKIRVRLPTQVRFYYPDVSVICRPNSQIESFQDEPAAVIEVLSQATRRIDEGEKKDAYLTIPSLCLYVLVDQESPCAVVFRRTPQGFAREVYDGMDGKIPMSEIESDLALAEIYQGVEFSSEPEKLEIDKG
jgi:Uma2 family endonuclease